MQARSFRMKLDVVTYPGMALSRSCQTSSRCLTPFMLRLCRLVCLHTRAIACMIMRPHQLTVLHRGLAGSRHETGQVVGAHRNL